LTSTSGALGSALALLAVPMALLLSPIVGGAETILHVWLGVSFVIVSFALFDFGTTRWISWLGCLGMGLLGAIFLLQGASDRSRSCCTCCPSCGSSWRAGGRGRSVDTAPGRLDSRRS